MVECFCFGLATKGNGSIFPTEAGDAVEEGHPR
jgi:hypothetical protein